MHKSWAKYTNDATEKKLRSSTPSMIAEHLKAEEKKKGRKRVKPGTIRADHKHVYINCIVVCEYYCVLDKCCSVCGKIKPSNGINYLVKRLPFKADYTEVTSKYPDYAVVFERNVN